MRKALVILLATSLLAISLIGISGIALADARHTAPPPPPRFTPPALQLPAGTPQHILDFLQRIGW